jgi:diguanylate cyclase (GGDEF)-like protein
MDGEVFANLKKEIAVMDKGGSVVVLHNTRKVELLIPSFSEMGMADDKVLRIKHGLEDIEDGLNKIIGLSGGKEISGSVESAQYELQYRMAAAVSQVRKGLLAVWGVESGILTLIDRKLTDGVNAVIGDLKDYVIYINVLVIAVIFLLTCASYVWGWFIVTPVRHMQRSLENIIFSSGSDTACSNIKDIPVVGLDEIGQVASLINILIAKIRMQCNFRRTIEADETAYDIYNRLADLFIHKLELKSFVIYEHRKQKDNMEPVFIWPQELEEYLPDIQPSSKCRAKRTGALVSSIENPKICPVFPWQDAMSHVCIPMMVGGEILGVVQFLFPFVNCAERERKMQQAVHEARQFLQEALPVLKAKRLAQNLKDMATKDSLTGLFNRHYLEMYLDNIVAGIKRRNACLGILMCDLDYFKKVNDEYGHDVGDAVLKKLASILKAHARESDLVIRFGGEEFLVMLVDCEEGESVAVAERIRASVEETVIRMPGIELKKTLSIGVSEFPVDCAAIWEAIKYADVALYEAKSRGRNQVVRFDKEMWEQASY